MQTGRFDIPRCIFDVGRRRMHWPGGQRHLETLHRGYPLRDAVSSVGVILICQGHPGVDFPGESLGGALWGGERHVEKPLSLLLSPSAIVQRKAQFGHAGRQRHAPVPVEKPRLAVHVPCRRREVFACARMVAQSSEGGTCQNQRSAELSLIVSGSKRPLSLQCQRRLANPKSAPKSLGG